MAVSAVAVSAMLVLASCASDDEVAAEAADTGAAAEVAAAPAPAATTFGASASPRFIIPNAANQSPPDVNTVPTTAPTPRSTEAERDEERKGLIADLANARHNDVGGRTQPVVVRPYVATAADPAAAPAPIPEPDTTRLDAPPPPRPPEADGAPAKPAAGPAPANRIPTGS